jgi:DNA-binding transcriptional MerR regulator
MILRGKQLGLSLSEIGNLILPGSKNVKVTDIESTLSAEQIILQIGHLERQREEVEKAIVALRIAGERIKNKTTA